MDNYNGYTSGSGTGVRGTFYLIFGLAFIVFALAYYFGDSFERRQYTVPLTGTVTYCKTYQEVTKNDDGSEHTETFSNLTVDSKLDNGRQVSFIIAYERGTYQLGQQVQILSNESYTGAILARKHTSFGAFLILLLIGAVGIISAVMAWLGKGIPV